MTARWITADVFDGLAQLEDGSIDLVVTSPPFLALRSYLPADHPDKGKEIGSEATPAEFIDTLLAVTAELRRVLAPHGSICIELGDTYAGSSMSGGDDATNERYPAGRSGAMYGNGRTATKGSVEGWPLPKSKTLIPEMYRISLAYGFNPLTGQESPAGRWRIRNVVDWCRPNPPVGALGDKWRPATSDVVVACVSEKRYWDDIATRREHKTGDRAMYQSGSGTAIVPENAPRYRGKKCGSCGGTGVETHDPDGVPNRKPCRKCDGSGWTAEHVQQNNPAGGPLLDYWEIPPGGYQGAHYAVFPPALVEPLIKAMAPPKVCRTCGEPSRRIVETTSETCATYRAKFNGERVPGTGDWGGSGFDPTEKITLGWSDCGHDDYRPALILDPFAGSGTTLSVATGHGHDGIDLDERNRDLAYDRIGPLMWEEETA